MKNFSRDTLNRYVKDLRETKDEWMNKWSEHVEYMAKFKENGSMRAKGYDSVGVLDLNDIIQESYVAFLKAWNNVKWDEINESTNPEASLWAFLKKSANLNLNRQIREVKDGIKIPEHIVNTTKELRVFTSLFHKLDEMWLQTADDIGMPNYEAELLGFFLDSHFDEFLDKKASGERSLKGIERDIIKKLFGIESELGTYAELADYYEISNSSLRKVKSRALEKLKSPLSMRIIADFVQEYKIATSSNADNY